MTPHTRIGHPFLPLSAAIALAGCATNPATGANQLMLVSEAQEIQMGQQADTAVIATLTDPAALSVQPQRVDILTLTRSTTIEQLARERSSPVLGATLALINQVELQTPLASGRLVKWVVRP